MSAAAAFSELFDRMPQLVREAVAGLSQEDLARRPAPDANSIAWLVWHLTRVEDDHVSAAAAALGDARQAEHAEQAYPRLGFARRFDLPFPENAHGYGMSSEDVGRVRAPADLLVDYYDAVHAKTAGFLRVVGEADWARVVDDSWDPPVTLLVRMASVANEVAQHVGQAAYVRGLLDQRPDQQPDQQPDQRPDQRPN